MTPQPLIGLQTGPCGPLFFCILDGVLPATSQLALLFQSQRRTVIAPASDCMTGQTNLPRRWARALASPPSYARSGVCFARNSLTRDLAAVRASPAFHSGSSSQFGSSFESSSEIGQ